MSKRPSSPTGSARVDAILRYRSATEGVLCSSRCRELSRTGLTATVERPVFPGELLRIDVEPPMGGPSVLGLARVSWTGGDPEGAPGATIMRLRFLSFSEASRSALTAWLQELGSAEERASEAPRSPHDDSSVRALSRAIADSLLPPPPVLPGAAPSTESRVLSPVPAVLPHRATVPPPPGMYTRSSKTLSHAVDRVAPTVHAAMETARRSSRPPSTEAGATALGFGPSEPEPIGPAAKSRSQGEMSAARRTAEIRERLNRLQRRRDNTPLMVPLQRSNAAQTAPAYREPSDARVLADNAPVARVSLAPPLPLGALLNAPPETTRRSSPPPPGAAPPSEFSSSSWPALRVPAAVAAVGLPEQHEASPPPRAERRETIPPPASVDEAAMLHAAPPPYEQPAYEPQHERAELPMDGPSLPLSDAPWSVPAPPPRTGGVRPWVALCLVSVGVGAGVAYLIYGPGRASPNGTEPAAASAGTAEGPAVALDTDELLASQIALPEMPSLDDLASLQLPTPERRPTPDARTPSTAAATAGAAPSRTLTGAPAAPGASSPAPGMPAKLAPQPVSPPAGPHSASAAPAEPGSVPPPPPALPAALGGPAPAVLPAAPAESSAGSSPAPASRLERARACVARGDTECVIQLVKDARNEEELELWIETLRAQGRAAEARSAMQRFVDTFPGARRAPAYGRILTNTPQ